MVCFLQGNSFIMKIENYSRKLGKAKGTGTSILSKPHIICGFKLRIEIYLNGFGFGKGTHMSVYFELMKGKFDNFMEWPFDKIVSVILIGQDIKSKCYKLLSTAARNNKNDSFKSFRKPITDFNHGWGWSKFITLEKLHADGYIKNDILYIRTEIW